MRVTRAACLTVLLGGWLSGAAFAQGGPELPGPAVRYIVGQRILTESFEAKADVARFQATQQQRNTELRARQQALEATRQQLARAATPEERARLAQQEQQERTGLEADTVRAQAEMQSIQRQMQATMQARLKAVLDEMLQGQQVLLVLNAETAVVWAAPGTDLTSAVIEKLNARAAAAPRPPAN